MMRLLPMLLLACAAEPAPVEAHTADTGVSERRCGRMRCVTVTENCDGGPGLWCLCTTVTCANRCQTTVRTSEPECVEPEPLDWMEVADG